MRMRTAALAVLAGLAAWAGPPPAPALAVSDDRIVPFRFGDRDPGAVRPGRRSLPGGRIVAVAPEPGARTTFQVCPRGTTIVAGRAGAPACQVET